MHKCNGSVFYKTVMCFYNNVVLFELLNTEEWNYEVFQYSETPKYPKKIPQC